MLSRRELFVCSGLLAANEALTVLSNSGPYRVNIPPMNGHGCVVWKDDVFKLHVPACGMIFETNNERYAKYVYDWVKEIEPMTGAVTAYDDNFAEAEYYGMPDIKMAG